MKTIAVAALLTIAVTTFAQTAEDEFRRRYGGPPPSTAPSKSAQDEFARRYGVKPAPAPQRVAPAAQEDRFAGIKKAAMDLATLVPYRHADGKDWDLSPRFAYGREVATYGESKSFSSRPLPEWTYLNGKILQVTDGGLLFRRYEETDFLLHGDYELIFVKNVPNQRAVDDELYVLYAIADEPHSYVSAAGIRKTIPGFDFGTEPTEEAVAKLKVEAEKRNAETQKRIEAFNAKTLDAAAQRKKESDAKVIAFSQEQAVKGSGTYQFRLGKRYAEGDGVEKDLAKARAWLEAACTNDVSDARDLLVSLSKQ